jgi:ectoine hydroxylase-related dioxygenase (phytanoyl-CoA dioxygenase family)
VDCAAVEENGFCVLQQVVAPNEIADFVCAIESLASSREYSRRGERYALRDVFEALPQTRDFVRSKTVREILAPILGEDFFCVRALLFDKNPNANWKVPFHQDLTIEVQNRIEEDSFGPWSHKAGVLCAQPPRETLETMLTLRLHCDDCDSRNGALRVLAGSHQMGKLSAAKIQELRQTTREVVCEVPAGGVLLMRPLLLHASSPAVSPRHRRVLHFDFSARDLPLGFAMARQSVKICRSTYSRSAPLTPAAISRRLPKSHSKSDRRFK